MGIRLQAGSGASRLRGEGGVLLRAMQILAVQIPVQAQAGPQEPTPSQGQHKLCMLLQAPLILQSNVLRPPQTVLQLDGSLDRSCKQADTMSIIVLCCSLCDGT